SRRNDRGEGFAVGALRAVALFLSLRPGPVPGHRDALGEHARRESRRRGAQGRVALGARTRLAQRPRRVAVRSRLRGSKGIMESDPIEVAAAVIERPGELLLAQRPEGKPYSGYWEFPGGKIEPGEDPLGALSRELH